MLQAMKNQVKKVWLAHMRREDRRKRDALGLNEGHLPADLWGCDVNSAGHLTIGQVDTTDLARRFGTPLYVVDKARLLGNYHRFIESFRRYYPNVEVDYSYKTNPLPGVLSVLSEAGAGAEVISPFELWLALSLGVPPEKITFNGPAKTVDGIETAVSNGIKLINVDNPDEIETVQRFAAKYDRVQPVGVRVTTSVGWSSQFGLSIKTGAARKAFEEAHRADKLEACSLHIHLGTGIKDPRTYRQAVQEVLEFGASLQTDLGATLRYLDFGGGFGVRTVRSYTSNDLRLIANGYSPTVIDISAAPEIEEYAKIIGELLNQSWPTREGASPTVMFEPGRSITSDAQSLLLGVLAVKPHESGHYNAILDGGLNVAQPASFEIHEALPASQMNSAPTHRFNLCGPLCHPADVVGWQKHMPMLEVGDVVALMDAGAYFVSNQMHFSNPKVAAVIVDKGEATIIRGRETFEGVVRLDQAPAADKVA